jgi:hypothetical protein
VNELRRVTDDLIWRNRSIVVVGNMKESDGRRVSKIYRSYQD